MEKLGIEIPIKEMMSLSPKLIKQIREFVLENISKPST